MSFDHFTPSPHHSGFSFTPVITPPPTVDFDPFKEDPWRPLDDIHLHGTFRQPQPRKFVRIPVIEWKLVPVEHLEYYVRSGPYLSERPTKNGDPAECYRDANDHRTGRPPSAMESLSNTTTVFADVAAMRPKPERMYTTNHQAATTEEHAETSHPSMAPTRNGRVDTTQACPLTGFEFVLSHDATNLDYTPPTAPFQRIADDRDPVIPRPVNRMHTSCFGDIGLFADENVGHNVTSHGGHDPLNIPEPRLRGRRVPLGVLHDRYETTRMLISDNHRPVAGMPRLRARAPPTLPLHTRYGFCEDDGRLGRNSMTDGHAEDMIAPHAPPQRTIPLPVSPPFDNALEYDGDVEEFSEDGERAAHARAVASSVLHWAVIDDRSAI